tara:strand:- start:3125 stop:3769 length:645 start_codon:yes stop_codon:yes gene_type:complete
MDEEIQLINANTRKEKIKNFIIDNKKIIISTISFIVILLIVVFIYLDLKKKTKISIADKYNNITLNFNIKDKENVKNDLIELIYKNDKTYSPLALYFLIDNDILKDSNQINVFFDQVIDINSLDIEIKELIIFKKALYNSNFSNENELLNILGPILKKDSIWKSHAQFLLAEYFYSKNEKNKSKEFLNEIINLDTSNPSIKVEAQKKLNRDFSD